MPAALDHLADSVAGDRLDAGLSTVLAGISDPRQRRGVRHSVAAIAVLAACAVLAGCRSFSAIGQWAADASQEVRTALGIGETAPCESTIRRVLQRLDGDALDAALGAWAAQRTAPAPGVRRAVALDGKRLRGSGSVSTSPRHVLGAVDHAQGVVLAQRETPGKASEISEFAPLLQTLDLADAVVTADALHAQRGHADYLTHRGAHYLFTDGPIDRQVSMVRFLRSVRSARKTWRAM